MKGIPVLSRMVYKTVRIWISGGPFPYDIKNKSSLPHPYLSLGKRHNNVTRVDPYTSYNFVKMQVIFVSIRES